MRERATADSQPLRAARESAFSPAAGTGAWPARPSPAQALALQRTAGNRATARVLARWTAHPDKDKKGVMLPDSVAAELLRFSPPQNK